MRSVFVGLAALAIAGSAQAATMVNGSLEFSIPNPGTLATVSAGDPHISGWTDGDAGADHIGSYWAALDGVRSIDWSALAAGSLSQDVATSIGQRYLVGLFMSGSPGIAASVKTRTALAGAKSADFSVDSPLVATPDLIWTRYALFFTALASSTALTFASGIDSTWSPALDDIAIAAIPEPSSWAMIVAGIGFIGLASRRRRRPVAA